MRQKKSTTSSRLWDRERGTGVPLTINSISLTINSCAGAFGDRCREPLAHRPGDCETACRADTILTGAARSN